MQAQSPKPLSGRVALITGAAGGIGRAIALAFAQRGADLCLADIVPTDDLATLVARAGVRAIGQLMDVTRRADVHGAVDAARAAFGKVDILVNVAGIVSFGPASTLAEDEWDRVLATNLKGTFLCCQAVIPLMRAQGYGRIINMGSIIGKNGGNARAWIDPAERLRSSNIAYGAAKAGTHAVTFFLARELASDGITVNAIAPGPIVSSMTTAFPPSLKMLIPMGRMGTPEDVSEAAVFLASEGAGFITGEVLDVNGGMLAD
jgi:3-oxoacyl-[acyl-carrier protein] reductase